MSQSVKVDGKTVHVKPVSARVFFDIQEDNEGNDRAINMALMAASIVDDKGNPAFTAETVQDVALPDFRKLQTLVTKVNASDEDAEKN